MKLAFGAAFLVAVAESKRMATCTTSGDPHYKPFAGRGHKAKYTVMGEGEYTLAKTSDEKFHVSSCSWDVSKNRDAATTAGKKLTWNRDFQVTDGGVTVKVYGGDSQDYKLTVTGTDTFAPYTLGVHTDDSSWSCDSSRKGKMCKNFMKNSDVEVKLLKQKKTDTRGNQLVIKFPKTNRIVRANILTPGKMTHKFGTRTLFNMVVKVPKSDQTTMTGLCGESKNSMRDGTNGASTLAKYETDKLGAGMCEKTAGNEAVPTDSLIGQPNEPTPLTACTKEETQAAIQGCRSVDSEDELGCILDQLATCDADGIDGLLTWEQQKVDYTCPARSYISTQSWPLVSFEDCACLWGHTRDDDEESCTPKSVSVATTTAVKTSGACFCDGTAPRHCMHNALGDGSCGLPVDSDGKDCTNPNDAMDSSKCTCGTGTTDCTGTKYFLQVSKQPSLARPRAAFGEQPIVKLVDANGNTVQDSRTKVRISIANVVDEKCGGCNVATPCLHNNIGDNTCHAKHELFGDMVCPPGTTECLPKQSETKLYQTDPNQSTNDKDSLYRKSVECRMTHETSKTNFCSGTTPCKHENDGSCVQKTAFYTQKIAAAPIDTKKCKGTADWRRAVPSPVTGWFFETDSTCSMDQSKLGCSDDSHSYAMDKWCEVNCNPKYPGQPAFCPASHCDCYQDQAPAVAETADWRCPADRYNDGSCRCTPGTELCGAIEVELVNGVGAFEHLTIGTEGRYQLVAEVVMPDQNTGSNNVRVTGTTSVFDVTNPKTRGTTCRAQAAWRKPEMDKSPAHGEGKAWFYEDSKKCITRKNDGTCESVDTETTYAMDTWCKANACAAHTLVSHCEFYTPARDSADAKCASAKYDMFGDCCHADNVDACGVCGGDGSTCKVTSYMYEPVETNGDTNVIFNTPTADSSCSLKSPCMHLNDGSCLPKTWNSAKLVGEEQHAYWDRKATAAEQPGWKYGTWDVEGRLSKSIETQYEDGNMDCYCSAGTVDISKKMELEDKTKEDFVAALIVKVKDAVDSATDGKTPPEDVLIKNSGAAIGYNGAACKGSQMSLTSLYDNILCGAHYDGSGGKGSCTGRGNLANRMPTNTCCNDQVRSIQLPPMTTAKLYKHCSAPGSSGQQRYGSIENFGTTTKCFELPMDDVSNIVIEGNVLKVVAKVVGTVADYFESQCYDYVELCLADDTCKDALEAAEDLITEGEADFMAAMRDMAPTTANPAFSQLLTCAGLHADNFDNAEPIVTATPEIKVVAPEIVKTVPVTPVTPTNPTPPTVEVVNPTKVNNPINLITKVLTVVPRIISCQKPIQPCVAKRVSRITTFKTTVSTYARNGKNIINSKISRTESIFGRRRLVGAGATMVGMQVSTNGQQSMIGSATTSPASAAQFAAGSSSTTGAGSAAGLSTSGTALVVVGCVGLIALVAGVAHSRKSAVPKMQVTNSKEVTQTAANEDQTDVL